MPLFDISLNETRVLQEIWLNPGISRIRISKKLKLNKSTVTKIVSGLMDEGIVLSSQPGGSHSAKGRRPVGLDLNSEMGVVIGIEIQTDSWNAVALDIYGEIIDSLQPSGLLATGDIGELMCNAIDSAIAWQVKKGRSCIGVGLGLAGQIDPYLGVIHNSNPLAITEQFHFTREIASKYPMPVVIENDANCCCWNVMLEKKEQRERNYICLLIEMRPSSVGRNEGPGIAIGMGLVIRDSVLHGDDFSVGEFQSVFKRLDNPTQFQLHSDEAEELGSNSSVQRRIIAELAKNTALLVNVLNLKMVKIFADLLAEDEEITAIFKDEIQANWPYDSPVSCTVELSEQGSESVAIGAAGFLLRKFFFIPDVLEERSTTPSQGITVLRSALLSTAQAAATKL